MKYLKKQYNNTGTLPNSNLTTKNITDANTLRWYYCEEFNNIFLDAIEDILSTAEIPYTLNRETFILTLHDKNFFMLFGAYSSSYIKESFFSYPIEIPKNQLNVSNISIQNIFTYSGGTEYSYNFKLEVIYTEYSCYIYVTNVYNNYVYTLLAFTTVKILVDNTETIAYCCFNNMTMYNSNKDAARVHIGMPYNGKSLITNGAFKSLDGVFRGLSAGYVAPGKNTNYYGWLGNKIPLIPYLDSSYIFQYKGLYVTYSGQVVAGELYEINGKIYYAYNSSVLMGD